MSTDIFRTSYRELSNGEKEHIKKIKAKAAELLELYEPVKHMSARRAALATTALEESVMWATKAVTA